MWLVVMGGVHEHRLSVCVLRQEKKEIEQIENDMCLCISRLC